MIFRITFLYRSSYLKRNTKIKINIGSAIPVEELIHKEIDNIDRAKIKIVVRENIEKIKNGKRDLYF